MEYGLFIGSLILFAVLSTNALYRVAPVWLAPYREEGESLAGESPSSDRWWLLAISLLAYGLLLYRFGPSWLFGAGVLFATLLIWLSYLDMKEFILPDRLTVPLFTLGIGQSILPLFNTILESMLGAVIGYGVLWSVAALYKLIRKREGMGRGDFKLLSAIGVWTGPFMLPLVIFLSAILGIGIALLRRVVLGAPLSSPFPYGPALCAAGFVALLYGNSLLGWYLNLLH